MIRFFDFRIKEDVRLKYEKVDNIVYREDGFMEITDIYGALYEAQLIFFE